MKFDFPEPVDGSVNAIIYNKMGLVFNRINFKGTIEIRCLKFTTPGSQLLKLTEQIIDKKYIDSICDYFNKKSISISIEEINLKNGVETIKRS
ncbi:MAG: hypothetical protein U5N56_00240 [Candidatus Marinimicrobia bacterium]|nr:hypothetical protein [Candidatus Neomarinimicrobiota bacterium]